MMSSRLRQLILTIVLGVLFISISLIAAQDTTTHTLTPGVTTTGALDATAVAQVYTVTASSGQTVSVTVTTKSGARLALVMSDAAGASLGQVVAKAANDNAVLENIAIPASGTYYLTVLDGTGAPTKQIAFEITFQLGTSTTGTLPTAGQLLTATGLQFKLAWDTVANLDLEVRDPVGGSLFWETPTVTSGGKFSANANGACNAVSQTPSEEASWPAGVVPTGSYEMIVYFQQQTDCPNNNPANLTLTVTLDSKQVSEVKATIQPNQTYLASVVINPDGTVASGANGAKIDPPTVTGIDLKSTTPITQNTPVAGVITSKQPYQNYSFTAQAGDVVSAQIDSNSGSLDTLLLLVDPSGNIVASNDDRAKGETDSSIQNFSIIVAGTYTLVATRYAQALGGTEGGYTLTLTGAVSATATGTQTAEVQVPVFNNVPRGSVEVSLQWSTAADIQLLVRDPQGDSVYDDKPTIPSGGTLAANGNNNCQASNGTSPVSYIYWPEGRLPTAGAYEIEVLYQSNCNDTTPVQFVLTVVANGKVVLQKNELLGTDQRYVISYNIGLDGQITAGDGGIFGTKQKPDAASLLTSVVAEMPAAPPLTAAQPATGSIRANNKFDVYLFDGKAGQVATISMEKLNGTLDSVLFLIGPGGDQLTQNDDAAADTNNSLINNFILPVDGKYTVIATHFGGQYGVTAGDYRLTLRLN
jgi:hypothetical protein